MALIAKANMVDATSSGWASAATEGSPIGSGVWVCIHPMMRLDLCEKDCVVVAMATYLFAHF